MGFSQIDLELFLNENYLTFLLLGGLLIVMNAYHNVPVKADRNFLLIILVLLVMSIDNSLETWATYSPERIDFRMATSVIHYILQPFVIFLELVIILPPSRGHTGKVKQFLLFIPILLNTLIYLAAPFTGGVVFSFDEDYIFDRGPLGISIYIVTFFYLFLLMYWTITVHRSGDRRKSMILLFMVGIGVLTGVLEYLNIVSGYIDEAFALGIFLYYMYLVTMHESELQKDLAEKELELSRKQLALLRQQIRPHFIFNSLQIIKSLIRTDRDKAVRSVEDFSEYLRANLVAISSDNLIPFEEELSHVEAYLSLVFADDSNHVNVEYDIKERYFRLPPLTVEPLVENAVQHGLKHGGTLTIATYDEPGYYVIDVSDDGEGFDACKDTSHENSGTGLKNARARLATTCGGTIEIESNNSGTCASVRIPKDQTGAVQR